METENGNSQDQNLPDNMETENRNSNVIDDQEPIEQQDMDTEHTEPEAQESEPQNRESFNGDESLESDLTPVPALETSHAVSDQSESAVESSEAGEAVESATSHETVVNTHEISEVSDLEGDPKSPQTNGVAEKPNNMDSNNVGGNHVTDPKASGQEVKKEEEIVAEQEGACSALTPLNPSDVEKGELLQNKDNSDNVSVSQKKDFIRWLKKKEVLFCMVSGVVLLIGIILIIVGITTMNSKCSNSQYMKSENGYHENGPILRSGHHGSHEDFDEMLVDYKHIHSHESNKTEEEVVELNLAEGQSAYQSSSGEYNASLAVDGNISTKKDTCSQTGIQIRPYWYVDLGSPQYVTRVKIYTASDCCMGELHDFEVRVGDNTDDMEMNELCKHHMGTALKTSINIHCDRVIHGQFVSIQLLGDADRPRDRLTLCEVKVFR